MKKMKVSKKKILFIIAILICIISFVVVTITKRQSKIELTPELARMQEYDKVNLGDDKVVDENGENIQVSFDAFFLQDIDGDGKAESVRGSCRQIGQGNGSMIYMDLKVLEGARIEDTKITINADNCYFYTNLVKDTQIAENYINSTNTKEIKLNPMGNLQGDEGSNNNGEQKLIMGYVRSGDYSSSYYKTSAIGNDTNKYSSDKNSITISGTYVHVSTDEEGNTVEEKTKFSKEVPFTVDWYGSVNSGITSDGSNKTFNDINDLLTSDGLKLSFSVRATESINELIMKKNKIFGKMPQLNGYLPTSVQILGTNVEYTYDIGTGEFTAERVSNINENGIVTSQAYTSSSGSTRYNNYTFQVVYPIEAYEAMGKPEDIQSFSITIPVNTVNEGYNNPNKEFINPYISNESSTSLTYTWTKYRHIEYIYSPSIDIYVGDYVGNPYYQNIISKVKPINIYNGISQTEKDDTYKVEWRAYTGTNGITDGIILEETAGEIDKFVTSSGDIRMESEDEEGTTNKAIYFGGTINTLGNDGWIKVYNADTNVEIASFTSSNCPTSASSAYKYEVPIKRIRVETSATNANTNFYVYNVKELDDEYITNKYTREEFDGFTNIRSHLTGKMLLKGSTTEGEDGTTTIVPNYHFSGSKSNTAKYVAPVSAASISIVENTISSQITAEHEKITITTETSGYNMQKWKNGVFLVKMPKEIVLTEINSVTTNNPNVKIQAFGVEEDEEKTSYIKIFTSNETEESFSIIIDCNLTADPRNRKLTTNLTLYAKNEIACEYYYPGADIYDTDGNGNRDELVNVRTTGLTIDPGTSLATTQEASNYAVDTDGTTLAPRVAKTDKGQRTATITISATNNYDMEVKNIEMLGVVPFKGNQYVITGTDLKSEFTVTMGENGIRPVDPSLEPYVKIYYSTRERLSDVDSRDITIEANGWTEAEGITNWKNVKNYLIVVDDNYTLNYGQKIEFTYDINLPEGIDYNKITYSEHAVYYSIKTEDGLYDTSTGSAKLGFMIARQYDLELEKYQEKTNKKLSGITFSITEEGQDTSSIQVTDEKGILKVLGLYVERFYTIKEIRTTEDYVLNDQEIRFFVTSQYDEQDKKDKLVPVYVNEDGSYSNLEDVFPAFVRQVESFDNNDRRGVDYKIKIKLDNKVKVKLEMTKLNGDGNAFRNVKFMLKGKEKDEIITTNSEGKFKISGLYLDEVYELSEFKATDHYVLGEDEKVRFKVVTNGDNFEVKDFTYSDEFSKYNIEIAEPTITTEDYIPTVSLNIKNAKIPSYSMQITKYAKDEKDAEGNDKVLKNAQYRITGEGIKEGGKVYTTDENGKITIDGIYEYVNGKYITGEYTIEEIYAPEGYSLTNIPLKFKAYREGGVLKVEQLEQGEENLIRTVTLEDGTEQLDLSIDGAETETPTIKIGVEDIQIFSIYKYTTEGGKEVPIANTQFEVTDLEGNYVTGSDGRIVGERVIDENGVDHYIVTTDENGLVRANLKEGKYKVTEYKTGDDKYQLVSEPKYVGIGVSQAATWDWANGISGNGWNYINSVEAAQDGGVISVGSISSYTSDIVPGATGKVNPDAGNTDVIEGNIVSQGKDDGIITEYDSDGNLVWSKTFGGDGDDALNKITKVSGGYIAAGYVSSSEVKYNGTAIPTLSKTAKLGQRDGVLIKIDTRGEYLWGVRFGGTQDDEVQSVIETSEGKLAISGSYYSKSFDFGNSKTIIGNGTTRKAFLATFSAQGVCEWGIAIDSSSNIQDAPDLAEFAGGLAVAENQGTTAYVRLYTLAGETSSYRISNSSYWSLSNAKITSIDDISSNSLVVGVNSAANSNSNSFYDAKVYKMTFSGTAGTATNVYTLVGDRDDYISGVAATKDGGIILGGWYYSSYITGTDGLRLEGNANNFTNNGGNNYRVKANSYVVRLDSENKSIYSSRIYGGDSGAVDEYNMINSVAETKNGAIASGGSFTSKILNATNCDIEKEDGEENPPEEGVEKVAELFENNGNADGFVLVEGSTAPEVPESQRVTFENNLKTFKVTTEVLREEGATVDGGTITGDATIIGGVDYSKGNIKFSELVAYDNNAKRVIEIRPDENYKISLITINGVDYTHLVADEQEDEEGNRVVTIPIDKIDVFNNMREDVHVQVQFKNTISFVRVHHYLWDNGPTTTTVADSEYYTEEIGKTYETNPTTKSLIKIFQYKQYCETNGLNPEDYILSTINGEVLSDDSIGLPKNYTGTVPAEGVTVIYYYPNTVYKVTEHHYIEGTNDPVPDKNGNPVESVVVGNEYVTGDNYTAQEKHNEIHSTIDSSIYELVEVPENESGVIANEDVEVIYYYRLKTENINIKKVAQEDNTKVLEGTEFKLYERIGGEGTDELIDVKNPDTTKWNFVKNIVVGKNGLVNLENLLVSSEYRLVETRAADGRLLPKGQWKIEFNYKNDTTEEGATTLEGDTIETKEVSTTDKIKSNYIKITGIENPPALAIDYENDKLELPNSESYEMPTSGNTGVSNFYKIGMAIIFTGIIFVLMSRRKAFIKVAHTSSKKRPKRRKGRRYK